MESLEQWQGLMLQAGICLERATNLAAVGRLSGNIKFIRQIRKEIEQEIKEALANLRA